MSEAPKPSKFTKDKALTDIMAAGCKRVGIKVVSTPENGVGLTVLAKIDYLKSKHDFHFYKEEKA